MSRFTVRVEINVYPKGTETTSVDEEYDNWADADRAFCSYRDLTALPHSKIHHVDLIEHREEFIHKSAYKALSVPSNTDNVVTLPVAHHAHG